MKNSPSKSPLRRLVEQESGYEVLISTSAWHSLAKRAGKNGVPLSVVEQVYARGYLTADDDSNNSPEQQAFQRVDSFIHGGQAQELDEDLTEVTVPNGSRHLHIVRKVIKRYESKRNSLKEDVVDEEGVPPLGYTTAKGILKGIRGTYRIYRKAKKIHNQNQQRVAGAKLSSDKPKRRKFKYEIAAETKRRNARADEKSRASETAERERVSKESGISKEKIQTGHGSGPLDNDELSRIKKAENKSSNSEIDKNADGTKTWYARKGKGSGEHWVDRDSPFKAKLKVWAMNKLRDIRKKYENE